MNNIRRFSISLVLLIVYKVLGTINLKLLLLDFTQTQVMSSLDLNLIDIDVKFYGRKHNYRNGWSNISGIASPILLNCANVT